MNIFALKFTLLWNKFYIWNHKYHCFKNNQNGFFLDIGAHDGVTGNNTKFFEDLGWSGVCIEPIPSVFEELKKNRNCKLVNAALTDKKGKENFLKVNGYAEMLSGLLNNYDQRHLLRIQSEIVTMGGSSEVIECETITFLDLDLPRTIDYLSLDVEGSEYNVLNSIDFNKHQINVMTIEDNYNDPRITKILLENNFILYSQLSCDLVFINKNFKY